MTMTLASLAATVDRIAPTRLAYDWDNVGLLIGNPKTSVSRLLIALEANDEVIALGNESESPIPHRPRIQNRPGPTAPPAARLLPLP